MLFRRSLYSTFYYIFICIAVLLFSSHVWHPQPLIVPLPGVGFIDFTELVAPVILLIPISFMYYDSYEIELSMVCGVRTRTMFLSKFFAYFIYAMLSMGIIILLYRYIPYEGTGKIRIPIYIPEHYKIYMLVSAFVTLFFFAALVLFWRVLTRNCYIPIGISLFVYLIFQNNNNSIHNGRKDIRLALFDPFISNYLLGDTVTEDIVGHLWTTNRVLFFGVGLLLLGLSCLILNREKQHENFGD